MKFCSWVVACLGFSAILNAWADTSPLPETLAEDTEVLFTVDMRDATRIDGSPFIPFFEGVWVNGNFADWWAWGSGPAPYQMGDDGTRGDAMADDGIYSRIVLLPAGSSRRLEYRYGIDSQDNEFPEGTQRVRLVRADEAFKLPRDIFGQAVDETNGGGGGGDVGNIAIRKHNSGNVMLFWTSGAGVRVQRTASLVNPAWTDVPGTLGASTITLPASGTTAFFRLYRP